MRAMREVTVRTKSGKFTQSIEVGPHRLVGDEPASMGGEDEGPSPFELLLASLGTCTSMTIKMYADRKALPLSRVEVRLSQEKTSEALVIRRAIELEGDLNEEQRARLLEIANKCPVHKALTGTIRIESELTPPRT